MDYTSNYNSLSYMDNLYINRGYSNSDMGINIYPVIQPDTSDNWLARGHVPVYPIASVEIEDNLLSYRTDTALSANQGRVLAELISEIDTGGISQFNPVQGDNMILTGVYPNITFSAVDMRTTIIDALNSSSGEYALSANQGNVLSNRIDVAISAANTYTDSAINGVNSTITYVDNRVTAEATTRLNADQALSDRIDAIQVGGADASKLRSVVTNLSTTASAQALNLISTVYDAYADSTQQRYLTIPVVSETNAGILNADTLNQINTNTDNIQYLMNQGGLFRGNFATHAALTAFTVPSTWNTGDFVHVVDDEDHDDHKTIYDLLSDRTWSYGGPINYDPIAIATQTTTGVVLGSAANSDGKGYIESNGAISVTGWDALKTSISTLSTTTSTALANKVDKVTTASTIYGNTSTGGTNFTTIENADTWVSNDTTLPTTAAVNKQVSAVAQPKLVSGTNIKTVAGTSLLGSGDVSTVTTGKYATAVYNSAAAGPLAAIGWYDIATIGEDITNCGFTISIREEYNTLQAGQCNVQFNVVSLQRMPSIVNIFGQSYHYGAIRFTYDKKLQVYKRGDTTGGNDRFTITCEDGETNVSFLTTPTPVTNEPTVLAKAYVNTSSLTNANDFICNGSIVASSTTANIPEATSGILECNVAYNSELLRWKQTYSVTGKDYFYTRTYDGVTITTWSKHNNTDLLLPKQTFVGNGTSTIDIRVDNEVVTYAEGSSLNGCIAIKLDGRPIYHVLDIELYNTVGFTNYRVSLYRGLYRDVAVVGKYDNLRMYGVRFAYDGSNYWVLIGDAEQSHRVNIMTVRAEYGYSNAFNAIKPTISLITDTSIFTELSDFFTPKRTYTNTELNTAYATSGSTSITKATSGQLSAKISENAFNSLVLRGDGLYAGSPHRHMMTLSDNQTRTAIVTFTDMWGLGHNLDSLILMYGSSKIPVTGYWDGYTDNTEGIVAYMKGSSTPANTLGIYGIRTDGTFGGLLNLDANSTITDIVD